MQTYTTLGVRSVAFIIQSTAFSATHIEGRVLAFIHQLTEHMTNMSSQEFTNQVFECAFASTQSPPPPPPPPSLCLATALSVT